MVFAPPLPVTSTVVHCPGMSSKRAKGAIFAKSASFANLTKEKRMRENVKQQRQIIQTGSIKGLHAAKTGRKPNKRIAQSNALGTVDPLSCALKEQKEDERKGTSLTPVALTARQ